MVGIYETSDEVSENLQNLRRHYQGRRMPSFFNLDSSVVGLRPNVSAAPPLPRIRQPLAWSTLSKCSDSISSRCRKTCWAVLL